MLPTNTYEITIARHEHAGAVRWLADLDSRPTPRGRVLLALDDGHPVAALGIEDGSVVADPFRRTGHYVAALRQRARAEGAYEKVPSLRQRLLDGLRRPVVA